jgi:hypothetical protein
MLLNWLISILPDTLLLINLVRDMAMLLMINLTFLPLKINILGYHMGRHRRICWFQWFFSEISGDFMLSCVVDVAGHGADPGADLPPEKLRCIWSVSAPHASEVAGSAAPCLATWRFPKTQMGARPSTSTCIPGTSVHVTAARREGVSASDQAHAKMDLLQRPDFLRLHLGFMLQADPLRQQP